MVLYVCVRDKEEGMSKIKLVTVLSSIVLLTVAVLVGCDSASVCDGSKGVAEIASERFDAKCGDYGHGADGKTLYISELSDLNFKACDA